MPTKDCTLNSVVGGKKKTRSCIGKEEKISRSLFRGKNRFIRQSGSGMLCMGTRVGGWAPCKDYQLCYLLRPSEEGGETLNFSRGVLGSRPSLKLSPLAEGTR